jgi:hypothetical protein
MRMSKIVGAASLTVLACLLCSLVGCTPEQPDAPAEPPAAAGWPTSLENFDFVWTAEPGVDLTSDGAVVAARAYTESFYLVSVTGDEKYLYLGFTESVDKNQTQIGAPEGTAQLWPEASSASVWVGTARQHVLDVSRSGSEVVVTGCALLFGVGIEQDSGRYNAIVGNYSMPGPGVYPMRIGLHAPAETGGKVAPQQGPSRSAVDDVFNGWKVTSHQHGFLTEGRWAGYDRDQAECLKVAANEPGVERVDRRIPLLFSDFPMLSAAPGWPEKSAS